ncbi:MAG: helix-turn-helix transcriptional regulator [Deltaproteobacteria bacterium]|nr:helix-turn-helix transcriptional regulator [Deltaproteobacteria bacterium]
MRSSRTTLLLRYVGANVRRLRVRRGMTQEGLAEAVDLDSRYLQRVERGTVNLSIDVLVALADVFSVLPSRLLRRAEPESPKTGRPRKKRTKAGS